MTQQEVSSNLTGPYRWQDYADGANSPSIWSQLGAGLSLSGR